MSARETLVLLVTPWGAKSTEHLPSKKAARAHAEKLARDYSRGAFFFEVLEDDDGDFTVQEARS